LIIFSCIVYDNNACRTTGQNQANSIVFCKNKDAYQEGAVQTQFPLEELASIITKSWNG